MAEPRSPALILRFPAGMTALQRDRLVAVLAEHALVAIHESDVTDASHWTAHFANAEGRDAALHALAADPDYASTDLQPLEVEDEDWARRTQADLPAVTIGRVTVTPPWDVPKPSQRVPHDWITVVIEPSRGFGTGHHQSTRLCIALLQARELAGRRVVDVGTGSGVLAIVAARLGAAVVSAIDTDPDAIENARENIAINNVSQIVEAHVGDVATTTVAPADLVVANLTGTLLVRHASDVARLVRPGGALIASGFNVDERDRVSEAMRSFFELAETAEEDDWMAFALTRI